MHFLQTSNIFCQFLVCCCICTPERATCIVIFCIDDPYLLSLQHTQIAQMTADNPPQNLRDTRIKVCTSYKW